VVSGLILLAQVTVIPSVKAGCIVRPVRLFSFAPSGLGRDGIQPRVPLRSTLGYDPAPLRGSKGLQ